MPRLSVPTAYYVADVATFLGDTLESVLGSLTVKSAFAVDPSQRDAWIEEVHLLKAALENVDGVILLEFDVPRIGSRLDAVLVTGPTVFVIEFKVGQHEFRTADRNQAWDYALDLKNFHKASHSAPIVPILVATEAADADPRFLDPASDGVYPPVTCSARRLGDAIRLGIDRTAGAPLDAIAWAHAPYEPTPTIIEAAQALYAHHSVDAIARHDAGARNLGVTSLRVEEIIEEARRNGRKVIVFVTGVPGAGKTLVGLNIATKKRDDAPAHAVFLSGNGPLVKVLREALAGRDGATARKERQNAQGRSAAEDQSLHSKRASLPR